MAIDPNLTPIGSGFNRTLINTNFERIDDALQDALSRSGVSPNMMEADIDMNGNDLLNVGLIDVQSLTVDGDAIVFDEALAKGDKGDAATVSVGTVTTGAAGSSVIITNAGTSAAAVFNFTIPKGDTGASGAGTGDMVAAQNLNDVVSKPTAFANIKQAATETATGVVELATVAEATTGTDTTRATTPAGVAAAVAAGSAVLLLASGSVGSSLTLDLSTYTGYHSFEVKCSGISGTTNSQLGVQLGNGGVDTGASDYRYNRLDGNSSSGAFGTVNDTADYIALTGSTTFRSGCNADVEIKIINPLVSHRCMVKTTYMGTLASGDIAFAESWGQRSSSKVINTVKLLTSAGTISGGTYRLYGYK